MELKIKIPDYIQKILSLLSEHGFEAYIVGGCVRDSIMRIPPHDFDVATAADPCQIHSVLSDYTVIDTGIKHGTVTVLTDVCPVEITTFRADGEYTDFRRPNSVSFTSDLYKDLSRRDFTVNSLAYNASSGLIDPFRGADDITAKIIRCVGCPDTRFYEDALRIFRALRFSAVLGFSIEPHTSDSILRNAPLLRHIAAERLTSEFARLITGKNAAEVLIKFKPVISVFIPEILSIPDSYISKLNCVRAEFALRLGALLCALRQSCEFEQSVLNALSAMRLDNRTKKCTATLALNCGAPDIDPVQIIKTHGADLFFDILHINRTVYPENSDIWERLHSQGRQILSRCSSLSELAVNGRALLDTGIPSRSIGKILDRLLTSVMLGHLPNKKQTLLDKAQSLLQNQSDIV